MDGCNKKRPFNGIQEWPEIVLRPANEGWICKVSSLAHGVCQRYLKPKEKFHVVESYIVIQGICPWGDQSLANSLLGD